MTPEINSAQNAKAFEVQPPKAPQSFLIDQYHLILAQSIGQKAMHKVLKMDGILTALDIKTSRAELMFSDSSNMMALPNNLVLLKKSLFAISLHDKGEVLKIEQALRNADDGSICFWGKTWDMCGWDNNIHETESTYACDLCIASYQYLHEKGYALPYKNYSVEQLIEMGIYKIID